MPIWELDIVDVAGKSHSIRPAGLHKFYSATRDDWVCARELRPGETLRGLTGTAAVRSLARLPGVHRVYNMTVEGEHVYRVSAAGVLVHNTCPNQGPTGPGQGSNALDQLDSIAEAQKRIREGTDQGRRIVDIIEKSEQRVKNALRGPYDPED